MRPALFALCGLVTGCIPPTLGSGTPAWDAYAKTELGVSTYKSASVDLNDDGADEIILYATDPSWCGSGGCTLFVLAHEGSAFRVVSKTTISRPPIKLLDGSTNGWRDISVVVQGGGITEGQNVRLAFDGNRYPGNPTLPPASRLSKASGTILIDR